MRGNARLARYAAPAVFLLAATIAILLVRSALESGEVAPPSVATTSPTATTRTEPPPARTETAGETTDTAPNGAAFYEIQPGDTLAVVADEHGTTVEELLVLNPDLDPVALTIGQRIRVK